MVPFTITAEEVLQLNPDGLMLSNGPGNPEQLPEALDMIRGVQGRFRFLVFVWVINSLAWQMAQRLLK